jgi:hypothetical protein
MRIPIVRQQLVIARSNHCVYRTIVASSQARATTEEDSRENKSASAARSLGMLHSVGHNDRRRVNWQFSLTETSEIWSAVKHRAISPEFSDNCPHHMVMVSVFSRARKNRILEPSFLKSDLSM